jgi:hypothetical protein
MARSGQLIARPANGSSHGHVRLEKSPQKMAICSQVDEHATANHVALADEIE